MREVRERYRLERERAARIVMELRDRVAAIDADDAGPVTTLVDEIQRELSFSSLDRFATF